MKTTLDYKVLKTDRSYNLVLTLFLRKLGVKAREEDMLDFMTNQIFKDTEEYHFAGFTNQGILLKRKTYAD